MIWIIITLTLIWIISMIIKGSENWRNKIVEKRREKKCLDGNHKWGDSYDVQPDKQKSLVNQLWNTSQDPNSTFSNYSKYLIEKINTGEIIPKEHKCQWCGLETWKTEFDFDRINISETRNQKIDQLLR